ncbi:MAG: SDR family NAD(P)-dependent oxidoreductase [Propionibacteriaceae bacterium]|jgi:NAD(P)-dependent dehydrogenase (short-subunit alcohol dehydrogenase family)/rhamnose utilization protein RhaD (predicted bifunctional aldolase and dehydrogenase)|nr:SDR family NAD(P)-dependent oxidoreductase [Propionibacteriaceae bacterium]
MTMSLTEQILHIAHHFGGPQYARAAGGNASYKADGLLHIKPSGTTLAQLSADDLIPLRIALLVEAGRHGDPNQPDLIKQVAEQARVGVDDGRRPSVDMLVHAALPEALVVHLHPQIINAVACNEQAHELTEQILGPDVVVVDYANPGVGLAQAVEAARAEHTQRTGRAPGGLTVLRNHGILAAGNSTAEVIGLVEAATAKVQAAIDAHPRPPARRGPSRFQPGSDPGDEARRVEEMILTVAPVLRALLGGPGRLAQVTSDASDLVRSETQVGSPIISVGPLVPDEIIYAGSIPCVVEPKYAPLVDQVNTAVASYRQTYGRDPVMVLLPGKVLFGVGRDHGSARNALDTFTDTLKVAAYADRLGKVRVLDAEERHFIETWEAEEYRLKVAQAAPAGRLASKVVLLTGAVSGFGPGIAHGLVEQGANVVLADTNLAAAESEADRLQAHFGPGSAMAVAMDATSEQSQRQCLAQVVARYGGVDVLVYNAGTAKSGSVTEQRLEDFDLVTSVNYRGYFLAVRTVVPVMAAQHEVRPELMFDVIQINSTLGLRGARRNFAYAASRFAGIGLTESFALELIEAGIKVNAICPGSYLDGPAWSDPEAGLLVQYLRAGRVPGASSVADVRAHFEAAVPMGRGCLPADVVRALAYLVEQQYETGQALPVTGGQVMMN